MRKPIDRVQQNQCLYCRHLLAESTSQ